MRVPTFIACFIACARVFNYKMYLYIKHSKTFTLSLSHLLEYSHFPSTYSAALLKNTLTLARARAFLPYIKWKPNKRDSHTQFPDFSFSTPPTYARACSVCVRDLCTELHGHNCFFLYIWVISSCVRTKNYIGDARMSSCGFLCEGFPRFCVCVCLLLS